MRILVLGASGMLGNAMIRVLSENREWEVFGTVRSLNSQRYFSENIAEKLIGGIDVDQIDTVVQALIQSRPDVVINCVGMIKQLADADDPLQVIPINALLPHRLAKICELSGARFIHMSTDCVFLGDKGGYVETDPSDAKDLYGKSKYLGEVAYQNSITLRTSIIGHELQSANGLIGWFLSQSGQCNGYTKAIFSGFPTVVLSLIIRDVVIPCKKLSGVYHVAAQPISKFDLLKLVAETYGKQIEIIPNENLVIDRSLNAEKFHKETGYIAPAWTELIKLMYSYK